MKKIIQLTYIENQINQKKTEASMHASIHPVKYINNLECSYNEYIEEFDSEFTPIYAKSPLLFPPFTNRGGIKNNALESSTCVLTPPAFFSCIVDYLSITFSLADYMPTCFDRVEKLETFISELSHFLPNLKTCALNKGLFGYRQSLAMVRGETGCGLIGFDGNNDGCYVSLSGQGCVGVDMSRLRGFYQSLPKCKITRIDLAHDDLEGKVTVKDYKKMAETGAFAIKGTSPGSRYMDDMGSNAGCTLYVGKKVNGKEACIYEKGKQLGDELSPWVRVEGRITAVDRIVPFEAMTQPAQYLAALYPPFAFLTSNHAYIAILKKAGKISLDHITEYASISYGKLLYYLRFTQGLDFEQIYKLLARPGVPSRLQVVESSYVNLCPF